MGNHREEPLLECGGLSGSNSVVESQLPKLLVAGSIPVSRSNLRSRSRGGCPPKLVCGSTLRAIGLIIVSPRLMTTFSMAFAVVSELPGDTSIDSPKRFNASTESEGAGSYLRLASNAAIAARVHGVEIVTLNGGSFGEVGVYAVRSCRSQLSQLGGRCGR